MTPTDHFLLALIGVIDRQSTNVVEFADSRMIGYTSTPGGSVLLTRSEIDPCTGKVVDQDIGSATPQGARLKWEWRSESTTLIKYAREYKATSSRGVKETNGGQILAGQYVAPVAEWIFPEITAPGTQPAKLDFTQMTWLTNGLGPDANGKVWGQLFPWPDASAPAAPKACEAFTPTTSSTPVSSDATTPTSAAPSASGTADPTIPTPTANAGADLKIKPSAVATMIGKADNAASFPTDDLTYSWAQIAGPTVTLTGATAATAKFTVPSATSSVSYSFELTVTSSPKERSRRTRRRRQRHRHGDYHRLHMDQHSRWHHLGHRSDHRYYCKAHSAAVDSQSWRRPHHDGREWQSRKIHIQCSQHQTTLPGRQSHQHHRWHWQQDHNLSEA